MATPKQIIILKFSINGLTLYKSESLAGTKVLYCRDNIPKRLVIYHLDVTLKWRQENYFKMTLEQILLVKDSNKFLLAKLVTETH